MNSPTSNLRIAAVLGCLAALGPLAIDMYLPSLPQMAIALNATEGSIQYSLMTFFAGLTFGQLFYGPLSDRYGRKPMIYVGLAMFTVASVGCAMVSNLEQLLFFRLIQGLGGSIGLVIAMAVVRDLYTGHAAARMMAMVLMVLGVSPVLAPLVGSVVLAVGTWRTMFGLLAGVGAALLAFVALGLPETRSVELRKNSHPKDALKRYMGLLTSRQFMPFVLASATAQGAFFAYISGSASVFITMHGLSPTTYSLVFAANAVGLVLANQASPSLVRRFGAYRVSRLATGCGAIAGVLLMLLEFTNASSLLTHCVLLFAVVSSVGLIMPTLGLRAMEAHGAIAGTAAALMGAIQFVAASTTSGIVGSFANGTAIPLMSTIAVCGVSAFLLSMFAFPAERVRAGSH